MSTTKYEQVEFSKIIQSIEANKVVLPDFQRGFVWRDKNKQKALIASVLTRLPIGSILLLGATGTSYKYKKIGMKNVKPKIKDDSEVFALIDGQQRITVLTAFLSDELGSIGKEEDFASPTLSRRYFLKFYSVERLFREADDDIFGICGFNPATEIVQSKYPRFSTEQVKEKIELLEKSAHPVLADSSGCDIDELVKFCVTYSDDEMLLPLYYLYGSSTKIVENHRDLFRAVMVGIAKEYKRQYIEILKNGNTEMKLRVAKLFFEGRDLFDQLKEDIDKDSLEMKDCNSDLYENVSSNIEHKSISWANRVSEYLEDCIAKMELYKIEVEATNIVRAIDIYQNLNLGGKALDVFDLLLARASLDENNANLYEFVLEYVQQDHREEYQVIVDAYQNHPIIKEYAEYIKRRDEYSSLMEMGAIEKDGSLNSTFCNILMSLAGTLDYFTDDKGQIVLERINTITSQCTKSGQLLSMDYKKIHLVIQKALIGLNRASFFMQMRCGIRTISEPRYRLMVVILATILSENKWYNNKKIVMSLEAWYWSILFSGGFRIEQNRAFQEHLKKLLLYIVDLDDNKRKRPDYIISLCNSSFGDNRYNTEDILIMNNDFVEVDSAISDIICQYYLSLTYKDILQEKKEDTYKQKTISVFSAYDNDKQPLFPHRVFLVGDSEQKYGDADQMMKEKGSKYNSPLNILMVSGKTHREIAKKKLSEYAKNCDVKVLQTVGFDIDNAEKVSNRNEADIDSILRNRFKLLCCSLKERYAKCLEIKEDEIEDFYSKAKISEGE